MDIDLNLLPHVLALARHQNFARAADAMSISQPALSRIIGRLEKKLGVMLFDRTRDGVVPTEYGRLMIEQGRDILNRSSELRREISLMQGLKIGQLAVAVGPYPHVISAGSAMTRFVARCPNVQLRLEQLSPRAAVAKVLEGEVDLGIADVRDWQDDTRLEIELLPPHVGVWICRAGHPLERRKKLTLEEVLHYPMISCAMPRQFADLFGKYPNAGRLNNDSGQFNPAITIDSLALGPGFAAISDAIMLTPPILAAELLKRGELVILDLYLPWQHTNYGFIYKRDRSLSSVTKEYMAYVRAEEAEAVEVGRRLLDEFVSR
jgi:DNA-binding transcriptional LysR family regulator